MVVFFFVRDAGGLAAVFALGGLVGGLLDGLLLGGPGGDGDHDDVVEVERRDVDVGAVGRHGHVDGAASEGRGRRGDFAGEKVGPGSVVYGVRAGAGPRDEEGVARPSVKPLFGVAFLESFEERLVVGVILRSCFARKFLRLSILTLLSSRWLSNMMYLLLKLKLLNLPVCPLLDCTLGSEDLGADCGPPRCGHACRCRPREAAWRRRGTGRA